MALYVVVHHRDDLKQLWVNSWLNDQRLKAIQTTTEVADLCQDALAQDQTVFAHTWKGK